jgi:hypothetical protein
LIFYFILNRNIYYLTNFKGIPVNSAHYIHPKWTLCLGAPKIGCKSRTITGELFLADIGIPRVCWKRIGVKGWGMPWGSEYLVGLEYST